MADFGGVAIVIVVLFALLIAILSTIQIGLLELFLTIGAVGVAGGIAIRTGGALASEPWLALIGAAPTTIIIMIGALLSISWCDRLQYQRQSIRILNLIMGWFFIIGLFLGPIGVLHLIVKGFTNYGSDFSWGAICMMIPTIIPAVFGVVQLRRARSREHSPPSVSVRDPFNVNGSNQNEQ